MRMLIWIGVFVLGLGILSFVVPVPMSHSRSAKLAGASISITTHDTEMLPPAVSGLLCAAGVVLLIAGSRRSAA